jgi:CRP-like cAMP-binding protein
MTSPQTTSRPSRSAAIRWDRFASCADAAIHDAEPSMARSASMDESRIAAFSFFADLPAAELNELADAMNEVEVEAGAKVITLDDYANAIYFIEEGEASVLTEGGEATQALGPGETFGEIGLLLTGQRTATVVARTPMRLLSLAGLDFERIRARVPELERSLRRLGLERAAR